MTANRNSLKVGLYGTASYFLKWLAILPAVVGVVLAGTLWSESQNFKDRLLWISGAGLPALSLIMWMISVWLAKKAVKLEKNAEVKDAATPDAAKYEEPKKFTKIFLAAMLYPCAIWAVFGWFSKGGVGAVLGVIIAVLMFAPPLFLLGQQWNFDPPRRSTKVGLFLAMLSGYVLFTGIALLTITFIVKCWNGCYP